MSKFNQTPPNPGMPRPNGGNTPPKQPMDPPQDIKRGGGAGRFFRRFLLSFFTLIVLLVAALCLVMNLVFNGPSESARAVLTMSLTEASATKWVPALFMGKDAVAAIREKKADTLPDDMSSTSQIVIDRTNASDDEWAQHPDGIRIEEVKGKTYNAHVMLIKDPSRVYMATSLDDENGNLPEGAHFSTSKPGTRLNQQIEFEGAAAAINAGAFNDDGTANSTVGSVPAGLVVRDGKVISNTGHEFLPKDTPTGFAGFNQDDILVVAKNMTPEQAMEQNIRDLCQFGPVLIMNGVINEEAYNSNSGYNPRTAIGQRADGVVIFVCVDGRQAGSLGGSYKDVTDIMIEYGAVNACNMDGGSSSIMYYHDTQGLYGEAGAYTMINNYSLFQTEPRRMPNFWMVRPAQ